MDKVKIALALLKKHHFWVMTGMVVLLSFIGWFLATSRLWADYQSGRDKIVKKFGDLAKINSEDRENQTWIDGLVAETQRLKVKVGLAWEKVYTEQKENVLKWPPVLGPRNVAKLESLGPNDPIPVRIRDDYLNYIQTEFPRLLAIVDAADYRSDKAKLAPVKGVEAGEHDYKVIWHNQEKINKRLDWTTTPSSQEVREVQEDLWVYRALLTIINNLNDRATGNYNAKVKEIQNLFIGSDAAEKFQAGMSEGRIETPDAGGTTSGTSTTITTSTSGSGGRYVDEKGMPLAGTGGAGPVDPAAAAAGGAPAELKRMPVMMLLVMDQREISRLLVECANSPLPVEVRQFRVHSKSAEATGQQPGKDQSSYDMIVEVEGIIYIFNPPDHARLGDAAVAEASGGQPAGEASPPNVQRGKPDAVATPPAGDAGSAPADGAPADSGSEPEAAPGRAAGAEPDAAAGPADAAKTEEMSIESPEPN